MVRQTRQPGGGGGVVKVPCLALAPEGCQKSVQRRVKSSKWRARRYSAITAADIAHNHASYLHQIKPLAGFRLPPPGLVDASLPVPRSALTRSVAASLGLPVMQSLKPGKG